MSDAPLRLVQRNDGPRLNVAAQVPNQPSSQQNQRAPRVGPSNRYA